MHMNDYLLSCFIMIYVLSFKLSAAVPKYNPMFSQQQCPNTMEGLDEVIVYYFDAHLSSPNGLLSSHDMTIIETHS
jgi:hypothetical protein